MTEPGPADLAQFNWMTMAEAARYARVSVRTVKRALADGALQSSQAVPGGSHRFNRAWVDQWLARRAAKAAS